MYYEINTQKDAVQVGEYIRDLRPPLRVVVKRMGGRRSNKLNDFYHGVIIAKLAEYMGVYRHQAKGYIAVLFLTVREISHDTPVGELNQIAHSYNIFNYHGTLYQTIKTSRMNEREMMDFVDEVIMWMRTEVGVDVSDYNDEYINNHELKLIK